MLALMLIDRCELQYLCFAKLHILPSALLLRGSPEPGECFTSSIDPSGSGQEVIFRNIARYVCDFF